MRVRLVTFAIGAVVAASVTTHGCGGVLVPPGPRGGTGGSTEQTGIAGTFGRGGAVGRGGSGAASAGRGGSGPTGFGEPACPTTAFSLGSCSPDDVQFCYRPCGPQSVGVKSLTCQNGLYVQMSGCSFDPSRDYSCYAIPTTANVACPSGVTLQAAMPCDVAPCMLCNSAAGLPGGQFNDSTGAPKVGYCVCQPPDQGGLRTWSCATDTMWPCPVGAGCEGTVSTGVGGSVGSGGSGPGGMGGGSGGSGGGNGFGEPACVSTVAKGGPCTATDQQFCYKTCGPEKTGVKTETCTTAGTYAEMSGCSFDPSRDYSCYKIPVNANGLCPPMSTPMASAACDVPHCSLCNSLQGMVGGQYIDATGAPKVGWCVCQETNATGQRVWSCASDTAWPCPLGAGC